ncbi:MAG: Crp/Fnr family transcriptional regulator [Burkholderiales bacterium]
MTLDLGTVLGVIGTVLLCASFLVKSMLKLRALALASNVFFIAWGYFEWVWPTLALNSVILPLNAWHIWEIRKLTNVITRATEDSPVSQWLLPHMHRRSFKAGEVLFRKGDAADELIYIAGGELRMMELGERVGPGELIGEIGLFSPEKRRTQSLVCETDGELYHMTAEMIYRLYYQNPKLGFYLMRLVAQRLLRDVQRLDGKPVPV